MREFNLKRQMNYNDITADIGDLCTHCGRSTAWGSGNSLYIDRCPSGADAGLMLGEAEIIITVEGYICRECRVMDCDICSAEVLDDYVLDGRVMCSDCHDKEAEKGTCNCLDHMKPKGE